MYNNHLFIFLHYFKKFCLVFENNILETAVRPKQLISLASKEVRLTGWKPRV